MLRALKVEADKMQEQMDNVLMRLAANSSPLLPPEGPAQSCTGAARHV